MSAGCEMTTPSSSFTCLNENSSLRKVSHVSLTSETGLMKETLSSSTCSWNNDPRKISAQRKKKKNCEITFYAPLNCSSIICDKNLIARVSISKYLHWFPRRKRLGFVLFSNFVSTRNRFLAVSGLFSTCYKEVTDEMEITNLPIYTDRASKENKP